MGMNGQAIIFLQNSALKFYDIALSHATDIDQIQIIIETGILKRLAPLLGHTEVVVQLAALNTVGEIVKYGTSKQIQAVVGEGILEHFSEILQHPKEELIEKALFVLGNVTTSTYARSLLLNQNVLQYFSPLLLHPKEQIIQNALWILINVMSGSVDGVQIVIDAELFQFILLHLDKVQFAALRAVGEIVKYGTRKQIQAVVGEGILEHFSELLQHSKEELIEKALFVLGNVTTSTYARSLLLNQNVLQYFSPLLLHPKEQIIQNALWILSNVMSGSVDGVQIVIDAELFQFILLHLDKVQKLQVFF
ncbi:importin subunit alpha-3-like [Artemia franciscana]|uniref:importin subunit alpha-3-like n=1 Tax=Artemia franciscana TaxID=6661 RepID=UPI0032DAED6C